MTAGMRAAGITFMVLAIGLYAGGAGSLVYGGANDSDCVPTPLANGCSNYRGARMEVSIGYALLLAATLLTALGLTLLVLGLRTLRSR